jgi:Xaa-Pro aminopeptidase
MVLLVRVLMETNCNVAYACIDLHESAHFDRMAPLKEGMVITIEPG